MRTHKLIYMLISRPIAVGRAPCYSDKKGMP